MEDVQQPVACYQPVVWYGIPVDNAKRMQLIKQIALWTVIAVSLITVQTIWVLIFAFAVIQVDETTHLTAEQVTFLRTGLVAYAVVNFIISGGLYLLGYIAAKRSHKCLIITFLVIIGIQIIFCIYRIFDAGVVAVYFSALSWILVVIYLAFLTAESALGYYSFLLLRDLKPTQQIALVQVPAAVPEAAVQDFAEPDAAEC